MDSPATRGRPRSEDARVAVLQAVDDLLVEVGYTAMTMKGIAERAGVGRQTVYRWWATKAEILMEAVAIDARRELASETAAEFLRALDAFLSPSDAGASYLALLAAAQLDPAVADLLRGADPVRAVAAEALAADGAGYSDGDVARLVGPAVFAALSRLGRAPR